MIRKKAREYAFILLFEYRFQPDAIEGILKDFIDEYNPGDQQAYIEGVVGGVIENLSAIDEKINEFAKGWTTDRISNVNMAILRLAIYELDFCDDIPD